MRISDCMHYILPYCYDVQVEQTLLLYLQTFQWSYEEIALKIDQQLQKMSYIESNLADVLSHLCLKCFCEQTDQEYTWHSRPWWTVNGGKYSGGPLIH